MITSFATRVLLCAVLTASMNKPVERCEHGIKCYRKDKSHFKKFSHPVGHQWFLDGKDGISYDDAIETLKALPPKETVPTQDEAQQKEKAAAELRSQEEQLRIQQEQKEEQDAALREQQAHDAEQLHIRKEKDSLRAQQEELRVQKEARDKQLRIDQENRLRLQAAEEASQLRIQKEEKVAHVATDEHASTAEAATELKVGDNVMRKGEECTVVKINDEISPPSIVVRTPAGNEVDTELRLVQKVEKYEDAWLVADDTAQDHTAQLAKKGDTEAEQLETHTTLDTMRCFVVKYLGMPCAQADLPTQDHTAQDDHLQTQGDAAQADQLPTQETTLCLIGRSLGMPCAQAELPTQDHTAQPDPLSTEEEFNTCDSNCQREFLLKRVEAEIDEMSHDKLVVHARKQCHDEQCRDEIDSGDHARDLKQLVKDHMKTIVKHASEAGIQHVYKFDSLTKEEQVEQEAA